MIKIASLISLILGILLGSLLMGLAIENDIEKYVLGLAGPIVISISAGLAGFLSYKTLLENRLQAQKNRTLDAIDSLHSLSKEIPVVYANILKWSEQNSEGKNKNTFENLITSMPNALREKYHEFALQSDRLALGVMDGTYNHSLVMQLAMATFWQHWNTLKYYISYIRGDDHFLSKVFCNGLEEYLKTKGGLSLPRYNVPKYENGKFT